MEVRRILVLWCSPGGCPYCTASVYDQDIKFCGKLGGKKVPSSIMIPDICPLDIHELQLKIDFDQELSET